MEEHVYQFCRLPLSPYVEPGDPESGLLPEISSEPARKRGRRRLQGAGLQFPDVPHGQGGEEFRSRNRDGYDPGRYALLARFLNADPRIRWTLNYTTSP